MRPLSRHDVSGALQAFVRRALKERRLHFRIRSYSGNPYLMLLFRPRPPFTAAALVLAAVGALFTALTVLMTWPQAREFATHAADHQDVYFNMWRLGWFAHALASSPSTLFQGNIYYPEPNTLAFSDAMVVESLIASPLLWAGIRPVLVHNLLLLGAIVASAIAMFLLVNRLTRNRAAGVIAGIIFAFAPYRFEHYMHMELQWTMWMPLALWAVHRTIDSGRWQHGLQAGCFVALQMLSSVYYGIFLATLLPLVTGLLLLTVPRPQALRALKALAVGAAAAAIVCSIYALPYRAAARQVGPRPPDQIRQFSAQPSDYLVATPGNRIYGGLFESQGERRLFPGIVAVLLAIAGLLLRRATLTWLVYLVAMAAAFDMSLGLHSYAYRFLYDHVARLLRTTRSGPPRHLRRHVSGCTCGEWLRRLTRRGDSNRPPPAGNTDSLRAAARIFRDFTRARSLRQCGATDLRAPPEAAPGSRGGIPGASEECHSRTRRPVYVHVHVPLEAARQRLQRPPSAVIPPPARATAVVSRRHIARRPSAGRREVCSRPPLGLSERETAVARSSDVSGTGRPGELEGWQGTGHFVSAGVTLTVKRCSDAVRLSAVFTT